MQLPDDVLNGRKILIVDDDPRNVFALTSYLEMLGMQILTSVNGYEAIMTMKQDSTIDVVLMDMMMPEMDGYETIGKIRQDDKISKVPIIAVTARAMKGDREKCLDAGADEYVSKPVSMQELLAKMANCLTTT